MRPRCGTRTYARPSDERETMTRTRAPRPAPARRRRALSTGAALVALTLLGACSAVDDAVDEVDGVSSADVPSRYVALGDSFTAAPFVPDAVEAEGCYRSTSNYPSLVAAALRDAAGNQPGPELVDVSCSGADTTHMTRPQTTVLQQRVAPQFDALTPETDLVTIGIGGNDFDVFGTLTGRCPQLAVRDPQGSPCRAALRRGGRDTLLSALGRTQQGARGRRGGARAQPAGANRARQLPAADAREGLRVAAAGAWGQRVRPSGRRAPRPGAAPGREGDRRGAGRSVEGQRGPRDLLRRAVGQRTGDGLLAGAAVPPVRGGPAGGRGVGAGGAGLLRVPSAQSPSPAGPSSRRVTNWSSSRMRRPSCSALSALEPAFSPTTT
ncbi:hypothetical protein E2C04_05710 [Nocardioides daphniae]|uniref:SGNH hydrolase-type esterase domain-containing protein n=1 Tax=Nocardioides daphniae TaxID=402297 RepID=A0A4P7UD41_9ACTN|nr:hypothetical protein E2C04_05710 [Nocardioides daphniae]